MGGNWYYAYSTATSKLYYTLHLKYYLLKQSEPRMPPIWSQYILNTYEGSISYLPEKILTGRFGEPIGHRQKYLPNVGRMAG